MRVGLVIYGSLDIVSGGYLYDRQLVAHLRAAGDMVEIFSLPWRNYTRHLTDNFFNTLSQDIVRAQLDILIQDELNHPSLLWLNHKLARVVPYSIVSLVHHLRASESHPRVSQWLYRRVERAYLQSVNAFIFNSGTTRDAVYALAPNVRGTPHVIAYPAGDRFASDISTDDIFSRAHEAGPLRIVFVGNVIARKGLHTLFDALAQLPRADFELTIVGNRNIDAAYTRQLDAQIRAQHLSNARFVGGLTDAQLARVLRSSHVLAVPSEYEGYGIVYLEGMSFGLPALATTAGAAHEIITDGENGFLIAPNDARALAERLAKLGKDRALLARVGIAARARLERQPNWEASMARVRAALEKWIAPHP